MFLIAALHAEPEPQAILLTVAMDAATKAGRSFPPSAQTSMLTEKLPLFVTFCVTDVGFLEGGFEGGLVRLLGEELMLGPCEGDTEGLSLGLSEIEGNDEGDEDGSLLGWVEGDCDG